MVLNYMSYGPSAPPYIRAFTTGQKIRMHEWIVNDQYGEFALAETSIEALYEPYRGEYSSEGFTTGPNIPPLFQPGFDYEFVSCGPYGEYPPPLDYFDISFWHINGGLFNYSFDRFVSPSSYGLMIHKNNFAIKILQIDNSQPRNCYSTTGTASDGMVIKFVDNTFNNNITISPKDSLGINSPNLINELPQGLYKIEKNYGNGGVEETVIYKENN